MTKIPNTIETLEYTHSLTRPLKLTVVSVSLKPKTIRSCSIIRCGKEQWLRRKPAKRRKDETRRYDMDQMMLERRN